MTAALVFWGATAFGAEVASFPEKKAANLAPAKPEAQPELSADLPIEFNQNTKELIARENAELTTPQFTIRADKLTFNQKENTAQADGSVRLSYRAARILTKRAHYDIGRKHVQTQEVRAGINPIFVKGEEASGSPEALTVKNPTLYFVEPDPFGLNLKADSLTLYPDPNRAQLKGVTFRLGPIPFFYLPSYTQRIDERPPVRLKLNAGSRHSLGGFGEASVWWTKDPVWAPGVMLDYYAKRGVMAGPMLQYDYRKKGWEQWGDFKAGFIHDHGIEEADMLGNPIDTNRYYYEWVHKGHLTERVDITSVLNWWSDSRVTRDFRQDYWERNQFPDNFTELVYKGDFFYLDAFARYQTNDFYGVQQRLPSVSFDMVPIQIGKTGIYQQAQAGYVHLVQDSFQGTAGAPSLEDLFSNRYDAYYGLSRPFSPTTWSTITPVIGGRMTHYEHTLSDSGQYTRLLGQIGFDAQARIQGLWDFKSDTWGIDGLKHVLRPVMQYRYIPAADQGTGRIPDIDSYVFEDFPPILDLGSMRHLDEMYEINTLRVGVENILQTRGSNGIAARDLAYLNIYQDFNFTKDPQFGTYSDTYILLGLVPAQWLQFDIFNRFDSQDLTLREIRTRIRIKNGDKWFVDIGTNYLQHEIEQYYVHAFYRINEQFGLHGQWRYDTYYGGFTEQIYGLSQKLGNSWILRYELAFREGTEDYKGFSFNVRVDVLAF